MGQHVLHLLSHLSNPAVICAQTHESKPNRTRCYTYILTKNKKNKKLRSAESPTWTELMLNHVTDLLVVVCGTICLVLLMCSALSALVILVATKPSSAASS